MPRVQLRSHSEQIDPTQLALLFEELAKQGDPDSELDPAAEAQADAQLDSEIAQAEQSVPGKKRKRRKRFPHPGGFDTKKAVAK